MADLDSGVRLNPTTHRLELTQVNGEYPTDLDLYARTRLTTPTAVRKWCGFFAVLTNQKVSGEIVTDVRFKLSDGSTDYYWNTGASAWVPASINNWNTEQEVADNIDKYQNQSIQILINLSTQDSSKTPFVNEIHLLYDTDLVFLEDYFRSFKEDLINNIRPVLNYKFNSNGQSSIVFDSQVLENVVGVDYVYNDVSDPNHLSPLSGVSFDTSTKTLSLPSQPIGNRVTAKMIWIPPVVLSRSQDFTEIAKIPVINFDRITVENSKIVRPRPYVINKGTGYGYSFERLYQKTIRVPMTIITNSMRDLHVLGSEISKYFSNTPLLRSVGQDEYFPYRVVECFDDTYTPSQKELYSARITVLIENAVFLNEDAKQITGVKQFNVTGGNVEINVTQ